MNTRGRSWIKLGGFCAAGVVSAVLVTNTLSVPVRGRTVTYLAQFSSVEGLNVGNPVTMNGIRIGRVESIAFAGNPDGTSRADVGIEVKSEYTFTTDVTAAVRYGDMLGARYVALSDPDGVVMNVSTDDAPAKLAAGGIIPLAHTAPAVDLTALLNGFKPLFDALAPDQVNTLTRGFVETFSGQAQTLTTLLTQIAAMTTALSNNAGIFTQLIDNMSTLMRSIHTRQPQLEEMLGGLGRLSAAITSGDGQLELLIDQGNAVLATLAGTVERGAADYGDTITNLKNMLGSWQPNSDQFVALLGNLPQFGDAINHTTSYGGFVSLYLCNFTLKIASHEANIFGHRHSEVCQ
jgi:phospholipid/cholesterol/gamma-HCH transport system substrate-binding protein